MAFNPDLVPSFSSTADLLSRFPTGAPVPPAVITEGRNAQGDGGGCTFYYNSSDTTTADNLGTIRVDGANRRWYALTTGPVSLSLFTTGSGASGDDTTAITNWFSVIKGKTGYIPVSFGAYYTINSNIVITSHTGTKITCDANATINATAIPSGFVLERSNCLFCDFDFPILQCGYSGVIDTSTTSSTGYNKIGFTRLAGTGRQVTKPTDPMANKVGYYVKGPAAGLANFYNVVKPHSEIQGFDTGIAFYTPTSVGEMNSNGNVADSPHIENYWFGFYTNSVDNRCVDAGFFDADGTDASHLTEAVRIGDGVYATNFNYVTGNAEPGVSSRGANALANSTNNVVWLEDNCDHGPADAGTNNLMTHNAWFLNSAVNLVNSAGLIAGGTLALTLGGAIGVYFGSGAPTISAPQGSLYLRSDGSSTTTRMYVNTTGSTTWTSVTTAS